MKNKTIQRILVIRFRQMGDAILSTVLLNALRANYPNAVIDFVINTKIAPLFENHPSVDNIVSFTEDERHHAFTYIKKVWNVVHSNHYDVIIDMRSTVNTMLFALFSPSTSYRIGLRKSYTKLAFNYLMDGCGQKKNMLDHNLNFLLPLPNIKNHEKSLSLGITDKEKNDFKDYMIMQGINFLNPIMLCGVTTKIEAKSWAVERMIEILHRLMVQYPSLQIIFNYAPGIEEEKAHKIYEMLDSPKNIFINIQARSSRQMAAMASACTFYFGNEGGARHIVQTMGRPSLTICSPMANKITWIPQDGKIKAVGIASTDIVASEQLTDMSYDQIFNVITVDYVWKKLLTFCEELHIEPSGRV